MSIAERKKAFENAVSEHSEKYSEQTLKDFTEYWCEMDLKKKKMRFEGQKFFGFGRRLATWAKNEKKWNTPKIMNTKVNEAKLIEVDFKKYG